MVPAAITARILVAACILAGSSIASPGGDTATQESNVTRVAVTDLASAGAKDMCEARTINYITHALPQSCLTSAWKSPSPTANAEATSVEATAQSETRTTHRGGDGVTAVAADGASSQTELADTPPTTFMSFEDWKEMMLRRAGQDPQELRARKPSEHNADDRVHPDGGHGDLGEEGEISLTFEQYPDRGDKAPPPSRENLDRGAADQQGGDETSTTRGDKAVAVHRSKDAGKTCKERFSYASFDAGATVLKSSSGAKNTKAILVENKDTYMLLECASESKYVIVELSDDIWVDTVVLANFEFFSSMIRHFRVSVSDRYPVKMDKWRELGTFEARNSRDIQPFLVQNPQIYAKYVRIEFLTHFGNEFYCPVSLLRVHGSRMLDSWKDSETVRDDELLLDGEMHTNDGPDEEVSRHNDLSSRLATDTATNSDWPTCAPVAFGQILLDAMTPSCSTSATTAAEAHDKPTAGAPSTSMANKTAEARTLPSADTQAVKQVPTADSHSVKISVTESTMMTEVTPSTALNTSSVAEQILNETHANTTILVDASGNTTASERSSGVRPSNSTVSSALVGRTAASTSTPGSKLRSTPTSSGSASPTAQEGFFNAITKRLKQVEANLTLSLKYVEDQSRHVQEALQRGEQKQQTRISSFLNELNHTVLAELHNVREQYDQIWQSTVLALESQRDRSERDMMALGTRLNLLADEVVFQKRMAIVQSVILLSCLFLIIFSRGVQLPSLAPLMDPNPQSSCVTPASHLSPKQEPYKVERRDYASHSQVTPPRGTILTQQQTPSPDSSPPLVPKDDIAFQGPEQSEDFSAGPPRLSPPLAQNLSADVDLSDMPVKATGLSFDLSVNSANIKPRKPLPVLHEHPHMMDHR